MFSMPSTAVAECVQSETEQYGWVRIRQVDVVGIKCTLRKLCSVGRLYK